MPERDVRQPECYRLLCLIPVAPRPLLPVPAEHLIEPPHVPELGLEALLPMRPVLHPRLPVEHLRPDAASDVLELLGDGEAALHPRSTTHRTVLEPAHAGYLARGRAARTAPRREVLHVALEQSLEPQSIPDPEDRVFRLIVPHPLPLRVRLQPLEPRSQLLIALVNDLVRVPQA